MSTAKTEPQTLKHASKMVFAHYMLDMLQTALQQVLHCNLRDCNSDMESEEVLNYLLQSHVERMSTGLFLCLAPACLRHLSFKDCRHLTTEDVAAVLYKCCRAQMLSLENCDCLDIGSVIVSSRPALTSLVTINLTGCDGLRDDHVQELLKTCKHMHHLLVAETPITDMAFLVRRPQQHYLEITGQKGGRQDPALLAHLVTVDLSGCSQFTNHGLLHLCSLSGPTLRSINVQQTKVDFTGLLYLSGHSRLSANYFLRNVHRSTTPSQNPVRSERGHISLFTDWIQRSRSADESSLSVSVDPTAIQHQQVSLTNLGQGDVTRTDTDKCKSDCQGLEGDKRQVGHGDLNSGLKGDVMTDDPEEGNNCRVDQAAKPAKALEVDVDQVTVDFAEEEKTVGRMIQSPVRDLERGDCPADKTDEEGLTDHSNSVDPVDPAGAKTLTDYTQVAEQAVKERKEEGYPEVNQRDLCVEVKHTLSQVPAVQTRSEQDLMVVETAFGTQSDIHTDSLTVDGDLVNRAVAGDTSMPSSSSPANCTALSLLSSNQTAAEDQESGINAMNNGTACSKVYAGVAGDTGDSRLQTQEPVQLSPDLPHNDSSSSDPEGEVKERKYNSHSASQLSGPALATFSFWTEKLCSFSSTAAPVPSPMFSPKLMALAFTVPVMCDKVQRRPLACFETILKANPLLRELRLNLASSDDSLPHLEQSSSGLHSQLMELIGNNVPSLQHLTVNQEEGVANSLEDACVSRLLSKCTQLHSLDLSGCYALTDEAFHPLQCNQQMRTLNLSPSLVTLDIPFFVHGGHLSQLTALDLSWCEEVVEERLNQALSLSPSLTSLSLRRCPVTQHTLQVMGTCCTALRHLDIAGADELQDEGIVCLATALPHLTVLDLSGNAELGDDAIKALLTNCRCLEKANFSCLSRITAQPFIAIVAGCSWEQWLNDLCLSHLGTASDGKQKHTAAGSNSADTVWLHLAQKVKLSKMIPHRSTSYGSNLRHLDLSYCNCVAESSVRGVVTVCRGGLVLINYYRQQVQPYPMLS